MQPIFERMDYVQEHNDLFCHTLFITSNEPNLSERIQFQIIYANERRKWNLQFHSKINFSTDWNVKKDMSIIDE